VSFLSFLAGKTIADVGFLSSGWKMPSLFMEEFVLLSGITTKYVFKELSLWSTKQLMQHCFIFEEDSMGPSPLNPSNYSQTCSEEFLEQLLRLSMRTSHKYLEEITEDCWIGRLRTDATLDVARALKAGHELSADRFLGWVYYISMVRTARQTKVSAQEPAGLVAPAFPPNLTVDQQARVMRGMANMTLVWDAISSKHIKAVYGSHNVHGETRTAEVLLTEIPCVDVLGRLEFIFTRFTSSDSNEFDGFSFDQEALRNIYQFHDKNMSLHFL
jgi:hypothetical protein